MTKKVQISIACMFQCRAEVDVPSREEMVAGATPEVGIYADSVSMSHGRPTVYGAELTPEDARLASQMVYNALAVHCAERVAEATQKVLDEYGQASVPASAFSVPNGGASA